MNVYINLSDNLSDYPGFYDKIWILFAGDKGGSFMKFHFEILNSKSVGSVVNVHCFCFEIMGKMFTYYFSSIKKMLEPDCVKVLLSRDLKFLHAMFGHQGSSASYPSIKDYVELSHLRERSSAPHTPESCGHEFEERTWAAIVLYNQEFNTDCRAKAGKHHYSLDKTILFPLSDIHDIVPPILHINLGAVLVLFEHLLSFIRDLDEEEGNQCKS